MTKIRIKATGEIKLVPDYVTISVEDCDSRGVPLTYSLEDIEIVDEGGNIISVPNDKTKIEFITDWEKIRIETAMKIHSHLIEHYNGTDARYRWGDIEKMAIEKAKTFIEKLKETAL
jgi:ADP-dependent phosphofructokinase/glucokinase